MLRSRVELVSQLRNLRSKWRNETAINKEYVKENEELKFEHRDIAEIQNKFEDEMAGINSNLSETLQQNDTMLCKAHNTAIGMWSRSLRADIISRLEFWRNRAWRATSRRGTMVNVALQAWLSLDEATHNDARLQLLKGLCILSWRQNKVNGLALPYAARKLWKRMPQQLVKNWVLSHKQEERVREHGMEILTAVESIKKRQQQRVHNIVARKLARWHYTLGYGVKRFVGCWRTQQALETFAAGRSLKKKLHDQGLLLASRTSAAGAKKQTLLRLIGYWREDLDKELTKLRERTSQKSVDAGPSNVSMSTEERNKLKGASDEDLLAMIMKEATDNPASPSSSPKSSPKRTLAPKARVKR